MKFIFLLLTAFPSAAEQDIIEDIISFNKVFDPFLRKLGGCPLTGHITGPEMCSPARSHWDYALFLKSRKAAAKLFDLRRELSAF